RLGDPTAKREGRLTLNPFKHLDPVGFLSMLILRFGWAKPVPYNPLYFKNIRQGTFLVALAGPLSNIILAFISLLILVNIPFSYNYGYLFLELLFIYNITFAVFNSLPIPPLDGSKIFASILPKSLTSSFYKFERYGYVVLLILLFTGVLVKILNPIVNFVM